PSRQRPHAGVDADAKGRTGHASGSRRLHRERSRRADHGGNPWPGPRLCPVAENPAVAAQRRAEARLVRLAVTPNRSLSPLSQPQGPTGARQGLCRIHAGAVATTSGSSVVAAHPAQTLPRLAKEPRAARRGAGGGEGGGAAPRPAAARPPPPDGSRPSSG